MAVRYQRGKAIDRVFVDSNIWIYAAMFDDLNRHQIASERLHELENSNRIVVSTQILNEVFSVATRKFGADAQFARKMVGRIARNRLIIVDLAIIDRAIDIHILEQISYWDALMLAAAISANCTTLLTEDLTHGQVIQGIRIENPFL